MGLYMYGKSLLPNVRYYFHANATCVFLDIILHIGANTVNCDSNSRKSSVKVPLPDQKCPVFNRIALYSPVGLTVEQREHFAQVIVNTEISYSGGIDAIIYYIILFHTTTQWVISCSDGGGTHDDKALRLSRGLRTSLHIIRVWNSITYIQMLTEVILVQTDLNVIQKISQLNIPVT